VSAAGGQRADGRVRAVVENLCPAVDGGRFAVKRIVGDRVVVEADCFADGHDALAARLLWRPESETRWREAPMTPVGNDRWRGSFTVEALGRYRYTVTAWVDRFLSWQHDFRRRVDPDDLKLAALTGAALLEEAAVRALTQGSATSGHTTDGAGEPQAAPADEPASAAADQAAADDAALLRAAAQRLRQLAQQADLEALRLAALDEALAAAALRRADRALAVVHPVQMPLVVDRERARFSAWYEFFPRSAAREPGRHGTFRDCEQMLPYVAQMGFDVVYFPPIHPIGRLQRKGRNNTLVAGADDVGSPWAIGAREGGHRSVHAPLGTLADFQRLLGVAREFGIEIALDIAFQCAPDHPYVEQHPQWFRRRADGSVQYAENPPKKYQDILPFDFESADWQALWRELAGVMEFWLECGVRIFRVDNPHTKSFAFWEWSIATLKARYPDALFLAEAFTRPKVMHRLAKLGFSQSYTYFAWRNTRRELTEYFTELAHGPGREYFRPNAWPNTPDILPEALQHGGRPAFMSRLVLAATLCSNYGIYGPAYEHMIAAAREPGSEEYLDSEKYELKHWDLARPDSLAPFIGRVNLIRRENPALHRNDTLRFLPTDNDQILAYAKSAAGLDNIVVCVVNLDPHHVQSGHVDLDPVAFGLDPAAPYGMHDLLTDAHYLWQGARNFVALDPARVPAHVFRLRRRVRSEHDFDYFA
jgi:starch synthase (maltosyl-transferring)